MTCGGGAGMVGGAAGVLMDLVCQETEPPDKTEDSAIEVWASPNKRDDSGIEVSESPDKRHDSAIGGLEIPAGRSRSRRECRETPDKQDDSAIVVYESPNKRDGSVIGGVEIPTGRSRSRRECRETPNKRDDSAIKVSESPDKPHGSAIGAPERLRSGFPLGADDPGIQGDDAAGGGEEGVDVEFLDLGAGEDEVAELHEDVGEGVQVGRLEMAGA